MISVLLTLAMLLSMASFSAFAQDRAEVPMGEEAQAAERPTSSGGSRTLRERDSARLMAEEDVPEGVASLTLGGTATYYDTLQSALDAAKEAYTADPTVIPVVDLLQDVQECVTVGYDPREGYVSGIGYSNYRDSELVLNLNGHTMDGGGQAYFGTWDEATGDRDTHPDASVITVHYNTTLTLNGAGPDGQRGRITGGYSAVGGGILIGNANAGRDPIVPLPEGSKGAQVAIRDLEVSDNYVWYEGSSGRGGGGIALVSRQYVARNHLFLDNVLITNNTSEFDGGGLFCFRGEVEMTNSEITNNQCSCRGGGINCYENSTCRIENCKINNNTANVSGPDDNLGGSGGGICGESQIILEIIDSEIKDNTAVHGGGGIASVGGFNPEDEELSPDPDPKPDDWQFDCSLVNTTVTGNKSMYGGGVYGSWFIVMKITQGCVISNNTADGDGGGGVFLSNYSDLTVADSEINDNNASYGGGIYLYQSDYGYPDTAITVATATNSTVNGNTTSGNGAGVCCDYGSALTATSSEINENTTTGGGGGGICAYYGTLTLKDSSVQKNKAETNVGGGIATWPGTITVDKSVIANNTSGYGADDIYTGGDGYENSTLTMDRAYFGDAVLTADSKPISGWYRDTSTNRWSETDYCKKAIAAGEGTITTTSGLWLKAAHGAYADITYDLQGGTLGKDDEGNDVTNPSEYEPGFSTFTLHNPSKAGYTFAGWTGSNGEEPQTEVSVTTETTGELTYTANWTAIDYTVTYDLAGGATSSEQTTFTQHYGDKTAAIAEPTKAGYTFGGWTPAVAETVTGDAAYTAQWTAIDYTVTYDLAGGVTTSEETVFTQHYGDKTAAIAEPTKAGYTFGGWTPAVAETVTGDAAYTAQWTAIDYTVTYDLAGGVTTSEETVFTQHYGDKTAAIAEPTKAGYTFGGWTPAVAETVTGDAAYTAQWTATEYKITYELDGGALDEGESNPETYTVETETFTLANPTRSGYNFLGWTGSNGETAQIEVSVAQGTMGDLTYTANWSRRSGGGTSRPTPTPTPNPPEEDLDDPDVPLANLPTLNTEDHVAYLIGRPDGTIAPMDHITRGEVATIFFRLLSEESRNANWATSCGYVDMDGTEYFYNPVSTATKAGLIKGYTDGTFGGGRKITRAEMATIAARFLSDGDSGEDLFTDIAGHWAQQDINRAAKAGWFKTTDDNGNAVGSFRPDDYITRAEVVVMINRMLGRKANKDYLLPNMKVWPDNVDSEQTAWYYLDIQEATNSHDYTRTGIGQPETWVELIATPDWAAMERR